MAAFNSQEYNSYLTIHSHSYTSSDPDIFVLKTIDTREELENLRQIRNECRMFMTRFQGEITKEQQVQWFEALDQTKYVPYLVYFMGVIVGFCAVAYVDGTPWLTAGLHESVRGKGLGRKTFQAMIDLCKVQGYKTIMLDVLLTNPRAMLLYYDLGFRIVDVTERVAVMKLELE